MPNEQGRGGGVLIAVRNNTRNEEVNIKSDGDTNFKCVRLKLQNGYIYIYLGYIPPKHNNVEYYQKHLDNIKSIELTQEDQLLVLGDYNIPGIPWFFDDDLGCYFPTHITGNIADCFLNGMMNIGLFQLSNITNKFGNVLDYVYHTEPNIINIVKAPATLTAVAEGSNNDERIHYPLEWEIENIKHNNALTTSNDAIKCYKKANFEQMNTFWNEFDVKKITETHSIDEAGKIFYESMNKCIELYVPTTRLKNYSTHHPPWFNGQLINLKNKRDKARKRISIIGNTDEFDKINEEFVIYNNQRITEYQTEQNQLCKSNPKKFWEYVNSHRKTNGYPDVIYYNETQASNEKEAAQLFNEFFATVFMPENAAFDIDEYTQNYATNDDPIEPITVEEVVNELVSLDVSKGVGLDGVHPILLKNCATTIAKAVCALLNKSIELCEVPKVWKKMKIIPIHKSGKRSSVQQYRPIAIPPVLGKTQDKIMTKRLNGILDGKLSMHQHGFVKKRNTSTNVLELTQHGFKAFESKAQLDVFFADFSKAFDKVQHSILIDKLAKLNVSKKMLKWQWSFLTNRTQITKVGNSLSSELAITSGIIQGGHQSPTCFAAFINDLPEQIVNAIVENFADDTKIYRKVNSIENAIDLQLAIDKFQQWCTHNKLELNESKCHIMTLARKENSIMFDYKLNGASIHRVCEHKDLGIVIDPKLTMIPHMDKQINKAKAMLGLIKRMSAGVFTQDTIRTLYMCLVRSHLDYASVVYNPNIHLYKRQIESVQKQFVMYAMPNEQRDDYHRLRPYTERFNDLKLNGLIRRRTNSGILFIYDLMKGNIESSTLNEMIHLNNVQNYNLRNIDIIKIPAFSANYLYNNPFYVMCRDFNKIGNIYRESDTRAKFKSSIESLPDDYFDIKYSNH